MQNLILSIRLLLYSSIKGINFSVSEAVLLKLGFFVMEKESEE